MPGGDGTGPLGGGPLTGRAGGSCAGLDRLGFGNALAGRGAGAGRGFRAWAGRCLRGVWSGPGWSRPRRFAAGSGDPGRQGQAGLLQERIASLELALKELKQRQAELEREERAGGAGQADTT